MRVVHVDRRAHPAPRGASTPPPPTAGQSSALVAAGLVLAAVVLVGLTRLGGGALDAAEARTAADAAALAGAAEGRDAAAALAAANGGHLVAYRADGDEVTVTVAVGRGRATARAGRDGTWCRADTGEQEPISYTDPPCPSTPG